MYVCSFVDLLGYASSNFIPTSGINALDDGGNYITDPQSSSSNLLIMDSTLSSITETTAVISRESQVANLIFSNSYVNNYENSPILSTIGVNCCIHIDLIFDVKLN